MKRVATYLSWVWMLSCCAFAFIIFYTTKLFTHDPNFSGGPETPWLLPMLTSVFIGMASFAGMVLTGLMSTTEKVKSNFKAPLGMTIKRSIFLTILLIIISAVFMVGVVKGGLGFKPSNYTGQQLYDAINEYRVSQNKKPIPLELVICDNLVARYLKIKSGDVGHEGFEEWAKKEEIDQKYIPRAEMYIKDTYTVKDAIDFWDGSPGHRLTLLGDYDVGCSYANEGVGVVVFGNNLPK